MTDAFDEKDLTGDHNDHNDTNEAADSSNMKKGASNKNPEQNGSG